MSYDSYKQKILNFYRDNKRMPAYQEIMSLVGFKSKNAVYKLINKLVADEVLDKDSRGRLIPNQLVGEVPLLGLVEAGFPTLAEEHVLDTMNIDQYLIGDKNKDKTYMLEVKGDSMIEAGINEGDLVIAVKGGEPKDGDIVIADVDGGWTMKYFRKKGNTVFLEPANKKYKPIYPEVSLSIAAIVRGVIRKY
ncbi:MAG TPA: transcriptional repressor LexA [Candidatus Paceibacterota bacterium]|jgi:repressor LexA|nr:transcriptional repressor LexA [Candidatus Paceibacterota bacterium]